MRNKSPASKNPFVELDSLYAAQTGVRKNTLITNAIRSFPSSGAVKFAVTMTLLPHQLLILPRNYVFSITNGDEFTRNGLQAYSDEMVLYVSSYLSMTLSICLSVFTY